MSYGQTTYQQSRHAVIGGPFFQGEQAERAHIANDPDHRDSAPVYVAESQGQAQPLVGALAFIEEVEDPTDRLHALLLVGRTLNRHHQLNEAGELLQTVEGWSESSPEQSDFKYLIAADGCCEVRQALGRSGKDFVFRANETAARRGNDVNGDLRG